jgi:hypothetical protein
MFLSKRLRKFLCISCAFNLLIVSFLLSLSYYRKLINRFCKNFKPLLVKKYHGMATRYFTLAERSTISYQTTAIAGSVRLFCKLN